MSYDYDKLFKILLIGDSGVGKSCVLLKYVDDIYTESYISTIGVDFKIKTVNMGNRTVKLQIWDTAGQERFRTITSSYYRGAHGIVIAFDLTDRESFNHIKIWMDEVEKYATNDPYVILMGTKCDLEKKIVVDPASIKEFIKSNNIEYIQTSSKNNIGISELFDKLCGELDKKIELSDQKKNNIVIGDDISRRKGGCC